MKCPLISVIIPVYNVEDYLERCLDSVLDNTYRNLEIICINDGSPDGCQEILDRYKARDERIKVLVQENLGLSAARNTGIAAATGEYLYYLDSDDWVHTQAFEILLQIATKSGADIIVGGRKDSYELDVSLINSKFQKSISIHAYSADQAQMIGLLRSYVTGRLYKASSVDHLPFYNVVSGEDTAYNAMLMSRKRPCQITYVDLPLYFYFQGNVTSIVKKSTLNTYLLQSNWYLEHLHLFENIDYAVIHAFRGAFLYRYVGRFSNNPRLVRANAKKCLKKCKSALRNSEGLSLIKRLQLYVLSSSNALYRLSLRIKDSTYKDAERCARQKHRDAQVLSWEDIQ